MKMQTAHKRDIEKLFNSLAAEEKTAIITHGMAFYLSAIKKKLFIAREKVLDFEKKYKITLKELDSNGLPDDAGFEMHEDYIMWHHWHDMSQKLKKQIENYRTAELIGLSTIGAFDVSK
jgi:hypothetical protein